MTLFSIKKHSAGSALVVDGSSIDLSAYRRGEFRAQVVFMDFLHQLEIEIQKLISNTPNDKICVALTELTCAEAPIYRPNEPRGLDEVLTYRDKLRQMHAKSLLCRVPSLFIGRGHLCSPLLELSQLCLLRVWRDDASLMFSSPNSWVDNLFLGSPANLILRPSWAAPGGVVQSLHHAKRIGFLDSLIRGSSSDNDQIISQFIDSGFTTASGGECGPALDQKIICSIRRHEAGGAFGSAKDSKFAQNIPDATNTELREIDYVRHCLEDRQAPYWQKKQRNFSPSQRAEGLKAFGLAIDLSEAIPHPFLLTELAGDISMLVVTAQTAEQLLSGNERLKARFTQVYGGANASAFWQKSVVPALGAPNGRSSVSTLMPLRNGGYRLTSPDGVTVSLSSHKQEKSGSDRPNFMRITCPTDQVWSQLIHGWPELQMILRAFDVPVISNTEPDFYFLKPLFYSMFVANGLELGFSAAGLCTTLRANSFSDEYAAQYAERYSDHGFKSKIKSSRLSMAGAGDGLLIEYLRHYTEYFTQAFSGDDLTESFLLSFLLDDSNSQSRRIEYAPPILQEMKLHGIGKIKFVTFRPFAFDPDYEFFGLKRFPTHSRLMRRLNFRQKMCKFLQRLDEQRLSYFEQITQVKTASWLQQMMYDEGVR